MSRTVTALFDSRLDAECARARLASQVKLESTRVLTRDNADAVEDLNLKPEHADSLREALLRGDHLLVAKVARGEKPALLIELITHGTGGSTAPAGRAKPRQSFDFADSRMATHERGSAEDSSGGETTQVAEVPNPASVVAVAPAAELTTSGPAAFQWSSGEAPTEEAGTHGASDEIRVGEQQVGRGGSSLRVTRREEPAASHVALKDEHVELENRSARRCLTDAEVKAGGFLKDRVFEVVEMREVPVISKETIVREEVIIRKTLHERSETIRDTVRRTRVEVKELPSS